MTHCLWLLVLVSLALPVQRGMEPKDIHSIKDVGDPQISPDGSLVVCAVTQSSDDRSSSATHLWLLSASGEAPKRLTDEAGGSTPRWSPDGRLIAFYANRAGRDGLWVIAAGGGEARFVAPVLRTNFYLKGAGESLAWSPDSRRIAFLTSPESAPTATAVIGDNPALSGIPERLRRPLSREEIERLPPQTREMILRAQGSAAPASQWAPDAGPVARARSGDDPRVITRIQYKSRTSFSDSLQSHIFITDLQTQKTRQLTGGAYYEHSISWSPRGDEIVFVANREAEPDKVNNTDIFAANVTNGSVRQLTKTKGCEWTPVFSPDGSEIAYLATRREITTIDSVAEDAQVFVVPAGGGPAREMSRALDRRASAVRWAADGKSVLFTAGDRGKTLIFRADMAGQIMPLFDRAAQVGGFSISSKGDIALVLSELKRPAEVFFVASDREPKQLSSFNDAVVQSMSSAESREFKFQSDGLEVQGWLVLPLGTDPSRKYPVILSIHGGPHGMFGYGFNAQAQILAAKGYGVLMINPRGSSGYGQKFSDGCVNDWGGGDYRDLMNGVDSALSRFPFLDGTRMGVTGGSYGGYMTNWVVTQTDRFRAGVAVASLSNLVSFYATSLYQDLVHAEFNGPPWDNYEKLWERSPLAHIKKARTPLMLIHGELDNDVHITQAEEMYTALRMRGVESVFVRYPREGHGMREPRHREDQLARTIDWFEQRLK